MNVRSGMNAQTSVFLTTINKFYVIGSIRLLCDIHVCSISLLWGLVQSDCLESVEKGAKTRHNLRKYESYCRTKSKRKK